MSRTLNVEARPALPIEVDRVTGVRVFGEGGVVPVDTVTASVVEAGGQTWLRWWHNGIERAVNLDHVVELISDGSR